MGRVNQNDANTSHTKSVGFDFIEKNSKTYLSSDKYTHSQPVLGTVHSHNADKSGSQGISGQDIQWAGANTPGRPALVFENNPDGRGGFLDGIVAYKIDDWAPIDRKTLPPLQRVVGGKVSLSTPYYWTFLEKGGESAIFVLTKNIKTYALPTLAQI